MNLRSISLVLVALLGTAGCVSVPAGADRPVPAVSGRSGNVPAAQASVVPAEPPAVHDDLGRAEGRRRGADAKKRKKREAGSAPARRAGADAPPARTEARDQPRRVVPVRPERPRRAAAPRRAEPRRTYDMRSVCATGRGVASAGIVDLCRATYGR
ncbi:hypothetical protein [Streptomyces sp. NPDC049970]|uniref:hypothetical protein n=1 Tax=Streptomyces sp. NPDC049970 TaxID=3155033 RepID=UPI00342BA1C0